MANFPCITVFIGRGYGMVKFLRLVAYLFIIGVNSEDICYGLTFFHSWGYV